MSHFMTNNRLKLQEAPFFGGNLTIFLQENAYGATNTPPMSCEWHHNVTLSLCRSDFQFWPLLSPVVQSLTTWEHRVLLASKPFLISAITCLTLRSVTHVANQAWLKVGKWAELCGTAIQSQLVIEPEQAPDVPSPCKNKFNIEEDTWSSYQILSW